MPTDPPTYLYVIRAENGLCRIGITNNPARRLAEFRLVSPVPLDLAVCISHPSARQIEKKLHLQHGHNNHHGEWFRLSESDIESIATLGNHVDVSDDPSGIVIKHPHGNGFVYSARCSRCRRKSLLQQTDTQTLILDCRFCGCQQTFDLSRAISV